MSQAEFKRRLQLLMNKPENSVCADCPERQPRWASLIVPPPSCPPGSLPIGAFMCLECSGSHRRLGVHITFVRSINLDSWKEREVLAMENGGNKRVNEIFEAKLKNFGTHSGKPSATADGRTRERYIRDKYERRKFFDPAALDRRSNTEEEEEDSSEEESEEEVVVVKKKSVTSSSAKGRVPSIRAPSDAAKLRAESRKARLNAYRAKENANSNLGIPTPGNVKKQSSSATPKPAPAQEIDLLGFSNTLPQQEDSAKEDPAAPSIDLFAQISISSSATPNFSQGPTAESTISSSQTQHQPEKQAPQPQSQPQTQSKKLNNEEILSMFNAPAPNSFYPNAPASNPISNITPNHSMNNYNMQPVAAMQSVSMQSYGYPMMMQQQQTASMQSNNPNQLQYQAYNNSFMSANSSGYMRGSSTGFNNSATSTTSAQMFMRQSTGPNTTQQVTQLDRNGFPMF